MKIFCIGRNYSEHAKELGNQMPDEAVIFMKPKNALVMPGGNFYYPAFTNELHYEAELVLHVCKNGKFIQPRFAKQYYNQITVGIDFTARDVQDRLKKKGLPWEKAKAFDQSALVGKWKPIADFGNMGDIEFSLKKNDEVVQRGNSKDMMFNFDAILAEISEYFTLNIGDLIFTGTPAGVGEVVVSDVLKGYLFNEKVFEIEVR